MADTCAGRGTHHAGHVLMMPFPAHGHLHPVLAVAAELVRRGHRVTFATVAQFAGLVATTGAEPLVYTSVLAERRLPATFDPDYLAR
ncbi:MAG TPA: hypothetical protein VH352_01265, partial [Pseudonocardiaceae bacterium]|nr:hypothetical protein [Pseudonocardiaceae bacterium]